MLVFACLVAVCVILYFTMILPTYWLEVVHVDVNAGVGRRVLQLTDLHVEMLRVRPQRLRDIAIEERVDYIFFTGDFLTKASHLPKVKHILAVLSSVGVPMYTVLGNHDYHLRNVRPLLELLEYYHVTLLRNRAIKLDGFWLVGIDDLTTKHSDPLQAFKDVPSGATGIASTNSPAAAMTEELPVIVLAHDPNVVLDVKQPFSYLMAGHLHGKQFAIPGLFFLKQMGPLPKMGIYKGHHNFPMGPIYISKGLSQVGVNARFLVRCEVTIHDI